MMKLLLLLLSAMILASCATPGPSTGDPRVANIPTVELQARRLELYRTVPRAATRIAANKDIRGGSNLPSGQFVTEYHTFGGNLPQQDEIVVIERELNRRRSAGDKAAYYELDAPHVPPVGVQSGG